MKRWRFLPVMAMMSLGLFFPGQACAAEQGEVNWPKRLVISVPSSGNVPHLIVQAIAKTIEKHTPVERVIVQPMGGPSNWLGKMEKGDVDMAVNSGPDTVELMLGEGSWADNGPRPFLRTIIPGSRSMIGLITVPGKGIEKFADMKDKVVFMRKPGLSHFVRVGECMLASAGLTMDDLKKELPMINFREAAADIIEGRVDAAVTAASGPFMLELEQAAGQNLVIGPSAEEAVKLMELLPRGYYLDSLPAKSPHYNNSNAVERTIFYRNGMYAKEDMDPRIIYAIVKAVDENRAEWEPVASIATEWGTPYVDAPPYHEGVIQYYKEKGWWTGPIVEKHDALIKALK